ncbi:MAG: hypothetical protein H6723_01530 [Sandaracinus sp.]|nr:hypothetical protein [Sandaracinus sp.]
MWHMSGGFDDATGFGNDGAGSAATDAEGHRRAKTIPVGIIFGRADDRRLTSRAH